MKNKSKYFRLGGYSLLASAIVIAIAIAVNLFASAIPTKYTKFDTTAKALYTLGDLSLNVLNKLEDDVEINWLVAEGEEDEQINHLLQEYLNNSKHLSLKKSDPDLNPALISEYTSSFNPNSLIVSCNNRSRYVDYYDIYTIQYDAQQYYYYGTYDVDFSGENAITGAINYVINMECPKLYLLTGHGESALSTNYEAAVKNSNVDVENFSFFNAENIPEDAAALFINNPQSDITDEELEKLQNYLEDNGRLLLVTGVLNDGSVLKNINKLMSIYGVEAIEGMVVDPNSGNYASNYPMYLLPEILSNTITVPIKNNNYFILMPFSQGLVVSSVDDSNTFVSKLLKTSNNAYSKLSGFNMKTFEKEAGDIEGSFALGVAITKSKSENENSENGTKIVWYSSAYLMDEETSKQVAGANQSLFMNSISWLCNEDNTGVLIGAKSLAEEKLTMTSATAGILSAIFVAVIPVCYLVVGIVIWVKRRHR